MRRILLVTGLMLMFLSVVQAQKLNIGERAPELKVREWLRNKPVLENKAHLIEFFFSTSKPSVDRLPILAAYWSKYNSRMAIVVISKEEKEKVSSILLGSSGYSVAMDMDGKSFDSYGIQFVPFCVLVDSRGRVAWFGNSNSLTEQIIEKYL